MSSPGLLLPMVALAGIFATSALAKGRDRQTAADGFRSLGLPAWTVRLPGPELVAGLELALAVGLLVTSGWLLRVAATLASALCAAYLVLVLRAVRRPEPVHCACFGRLVDQSISWWTVARNATLLGCAGSAGYAAAAGTSVPALVADATSRDWLALGLALLVVALAVTLAAPSGAGEQTARAAIDDTAGDELDYLRHAIPYGLLYTDEGDPILLREWATRQARLLLFLNPSCGPCARVAELVPAWTTQLSGPVGVHVVRRGDGGLHRAEPGTLVDPDGVLASTLQIRGTPAAVLLGADGLLAGGPVDGANAVTDFVAEIAAQIGVASPPARPSSGQ